MSTLLRNGLILLTVLVLAVLAIVPPKDKLSLGKDLAGGASLVYAVDIKPGEGAEVLDKVRSVVKERLDPTGLLEISVVPLGTDRLEITMALPNADVKKLRADFDKTLAALNAATVTPDEFDRLTTSTPEQRAAWINDRAKSDDILKGRLEQAFRDYDADHAARTALAAAQAETNATKDKIRNLGTVDSSDPILTSLNTALAAAQAKEKSLVESVAQASLAYESSRASALTSGLSGAELRQALLLSDTPIRLPDATKHMIARPSLRAAALADIEKRDPEQKGKIDAAIASWNTYEKQRKSLDDPQDIVRLLKGAGVLNFRITVNLGEHANEAEIRSQLRQGGPGAVKADDARFFKVNKLEGWAETIDDLDAMRASPAAYFARRGLVAEEYKGQPYILCWDRRGLRLTENDGTWSLTKSYQGSDQLGRPAIDFQMDALGASKLGELTEKNVGRQMAVLLDDEVYTAPRLQSRISSSGQITGSFSQAELDYIIRVLGAGSLQAKLSPEPVSTSVLGPELGADNLRNSFVTGIIALVAVAGFMIVYYFGSGVIAVVALLVNFLLVLAMMALSHTAFTIPCIAGIVLTFGQAVDSNVLVYERMREEMHHGHDLKTAVRLGFSRALPPIVDGNISNLIICVVLGFLGTQEIRGFAITLGMGVVTTLFSTLFVSRFIFNVLIEKVGWRHANQLPMVVPFVQRMFTPHIDWMKLRWVLLGGLGVFLVASAGIIVHQGSELLGMEFRGGTAVTLTFKEIPGPDGSSKRMTLRREDVQKKVKAIAEAAPNGSPLKQLDKAQVIAVNPEADSVSSSTFTIKSIVTDPDILQPPLAVAFADVLETRLPLKFGGSDETSGAKAPAYPITGAVLGKSIEKPQVAMPTGEFYGGVAIVLDNLQPRPTLAELNDRFKSTRESSTYSDTSQRRVQIVVLDGSDSAVSSAVVMVKDAGRSYFDDEKLWGSSVRDKEWSLARSALTETKSIGSVQSFSPAIARTFATQGIVCMLMSLLLLTIYVFARFGTMRWAVAATVPLFADVIGIIGLLGVAQMLYENPATHGFARSIGLLPFDLDLAQIAAVLTIVGYSLNDKIIILDRIRENKGKLPYASYQCINDSINQTLSRTVITGGAHMITTIVLYLFGGEAVRGFAFTFNLGVLLGTYTSIVSTPLVWSHALDASVNPAAKFGSGASGGANGSMNGSSLSSAAAKAG